MLYAHNIQLFKVNNKLSQREVNKQLEKRSVYLHLFLFFCFYLFKSKEYLDKSSYLCTAAKHLQCHHYEH